MKKIVFLIFFIPLCSLSQKKIIFEKKDCPDAMGYGDCIYTITEMLRSSNQESKDFFKNSVVNFYDRVSFSCSYSKALQRDENEEVDTVSFSEIDYVPRFLLCHLEEEEEAKNCFQEQMNNHIRKTFRYPEAAQEQEIQGRVYTNFTINSCGFIENIRLRGPDKVLEDEAYRIISLIPRLLPGTLEDGTPVNVLFSLPITFRLK